MKSEQIKEITARATEQLVAALNAGRSEALTGYLKAIGRFHRYSLYNVMLSASQKPDASYVAGFRTWNQLGRYVKKGEKGILILAGPAPWSPALEWGCANAPIPRCSSGTESSLQVRSCISTDCAIQDQTQTRPGSAPSLRPVFRKSDVSAPAIL